MKKILLSVILIAVFVLYAFYHKSSNAVVTKSTSSSRASANNTQSTGVYKDGTYKGSAADAFYGTVQIQTTIQSGKITDVKFLQYPNDRDESVQVSNMAMPVLKQEAIQVQNAKVAVVSGATQTSQAFQQSLAAALSQAK